MPTIKLRAPNPDTNGVKVDGYDRIERNKEDGLFHVHDSNLAAKLQAHPWNMTVDSSNNDAAPKAKKAAEEKTLEEMTKPELIAWLDERGEKTEGLNKPDLLAAAQLRKEADDKKSGNNGEGN